MAYYVQPCDSYFVESHETSQRITRENARERERLRKQQTQAVIAEELSLLTSEEFREDVRYHMQEMEVSYITVLMFEHANYLPAPNLA